jgi:hypothetical protein
VLRAAQRLAQSFGIYVYRGPNPYHVVTDYPVSDKPRYGHKTPPHPIILSLIERHRDEYRAFLRDLERLQPLISSIKFNDSEVEPTEPYWNNPWLPPRDGAAFLRFILDGKPKRFMEIGSGNSTKFARLAVDHGKTGTTITSIDPQPRAEIDQICDRVIRKGLQDVDLGIFDELEAGDILSFDGSHRLFADSDVAVFFLEVLPRLKAGVIIQVHDIFWPNDYPPSWGDRFYSEQYMLGQLLILASDKIRILVANAFISEDPELRLLARDVVPGEGQLQKFGSGLLANAFWFKLEKSLA